MTLVTAAGLAGSVLASSGAGATDFTGFYAGVNGGYAKELRDGDQGSRSSQRSGTGGASGQGSAGAEPAPLRREDLPASMRAAPKSLDGR